MALIRKLRRVTNENPRVHPTKTDCECSSYEVDGKRYFQLTTFGSDTRESRGTTSQTMQFDEQSARALRDLLAESFR
jgi:hypothetical protein